MNQWLTINNFILSEIYIIKLEDFNHIQFKNMSLKNLKVLFRNIN